MSRLRAVSSTAWSAVGALALLATTSLVVVLAAGLHVWGGLALPTIRSGAPSAAHPGSGVVTVRTPVGGSASHPGSSAGPAANPAAPSAAGPTGVPAAAPPFAPRPVAVGPVATPPGGLRDNLLPLTNLTRTARELARISLERADSETARPHVRLAASRADEVGRGHRHHHHGARHHGHGHHHDHGMRGHGFDGRHHED